MSEPRHISECIGEWLTEYAAITASTITTPPDDTVVAATTKGTDV